MGIPTGNSHQSIEKTDHHIELECEEIPPPSDMSSPIHTTLVFIDGMHVDAFPPHPCTRACHQQGVDGKHVSNKRCRNSGGANNLAITLSSFAESSNKIKILKLETQKEAIK
jgi:hypothetical protein